MRTVCDLTRKELDELKETYLFQIKEEEGLSYNEICESTNISDNIIFNHYADITFSPDDFFCNQE